MKLLVNMDLISYGNFFVVLEEIVIIVELDIIGLFVYLYVIVLDE